MDFYEKYKNKRLLLMTNHPEKYEQWCKHAGRKEYMNNKKFNEWLKLEAKK